MGTIAAPSPLRSLAFFLFLAGCAGPPDLEAGEEVGQAAQAIQGGYSDLRDHAVVGLAVTDGNGHILRTCSGSLIAPNLVLTAQHCIAPTPRYVTCDSSLFGPPAPAARVFITQSESMWTSDTEWLPVADVMPSPGPSIVCGRDVALLMLGTMATAGAVPLAPRLDEMAEPGETYSAVGFGASAQSNGDAGLRRRRDRLEIVCVGQSCGSSGQVEGREWRGDHGICSGDSGGPAIDAAGRVIGVTSRGPTGCDDPIYGGLTGFKDWIRDEAIRAARAGGYVAAPWTLARAAEPAVSPSGAGGSWSSCAVSAGGRSSPGGALFLLTAIAALLCGRRRA